MSENKSQPDGEQPPQPDTVKDGEQPEITDPNILVETVNQEDLGRALFDGDSKGIPAPETKEEVIPAGEKPATQPNPETEGEVATRKSPRRISVGGFSEEAKQEAAEAADLVRQGKATDLYDAISQIRGIEQTPAVDPDPNAEPEPEVEPETDAEPEPTLQEKLAKLREDYDEADDNFDKVGARQIRAEIEDTLLAIGRSERVAEAEERTTKKNVQTYEEAADASFDRAATDYPDLNDDNSKLTRYLDQAIDAAQVKNDPALKDPNIIQKFADEIASDLGIAKSTSKAPSRPAPAPTRQVKPVGSALAPGHSSPEVLTQAQSQSAIENASAEDLEAALFGS
tara:strand:- start:1558 stop:2580 length:1023 start_codon:yes stop_codon:yes gene_type:complete